jgi:hypothetical protein
MDDLSETFAELNVADTLAEAAQAVGFSKPTALQQRLLPVIQGGADVLLQAHGGSARSLAYLLPMMQRLLEREPQEGRGPRSLILSPSRDAAMKVGRMIKDLGRDSPLRFGTVVGGRPYPMQHQLLRRPLDILVATPSRLMDHIRRGRVPFERLEMLVIDRVDEMLEQGLKDDLEFIAGTSTAQCQTLLLAESINAELDGLSERLQREPERLELEEPPKAVQSSSSTESEAPVVKSNKPAVPRGEGQGRRRPRTGRNDQARKPRGQKNTAAPRGEVNGNVAPSTEKPKPKSKVNKNKQQTQGGNSKTGIRGPGRRSGGQQGRRKSDVRFPSDYANGPRSGHGQSPAEAAEQHREVKRHEPMQYLADYGFSSGPRTRKPVTVVYRGKGRKSARREGDDDEG